MSRAARSGLVTATLLAGSVGCGAKSDLDVPPRECRPPDPPPLSCPSLRAGEAVVISEGSESVTALDVAPFESGAIVLRRSILASGGAEQWRVVTLDGRGRVVDRGARDLIGETDDPLRRSEGSITAGCTPIALLEERVDAMGLEARCTLVPIDPLPIRFRPRALPTITAGCHDLLDDALGPSFVEPGLPTRVVHVSRDGAIGETSTLTPSGPWLTLRPQRLALANGGWAIPYFPSGGGVGVVLLDPTSRQIGETRWGIGDSPVGVATTTTRAVWEAANGPAEAPIRIETVGLLPDGRPEGEHHILPTEGFFILAYGLALVDVGEHTIFLFRGGRIGEEARVHVGTLDHEGNLLEGPTPLVSADRARLVPTANGAIAILVRGNRELAEVQAIPLDCE
ncbi:MAG: hypothetical protein J0L92_31775 [Deltaproteobacteria bacterium]|nr:hypothetical protein [Deltaproteobacteria bacterium]